MTSEFLKYADSKGINRAELNRKVQDVYRDMFNKGAFKNAEALYELTRIEPKVSKALLKKYLLGAAAGWCGVPDAFKKPLSKSDILSVFDKLLKKGVEPYTNWGTSFAGEVLVLYAELNFRDKKVVSKAHDLLLSNLRKGYKKFEEKDLEWEYSPDSLYTAFVKEAKKRGVTLDPKRIQTGYKLLLRHPPEYPDSQYGFEEVKKLTKIKPNLSKLDIQKAYEFIVKSTIRYAGPHTVVLPNFRIDRVHKATKIKPSFSSRFIEETYRALLRKNAAFYISYFSNLTKVRPKLSEKDRSRLSNLKALMLAKEGRLYQNYQYQYALEAGKLLGSKLDLGLTKQDVLNEYKNIVSNYRVLELISLAKLSGVRPPEELVQKVYISELSRGGEYSIRRYGEIKNATRVALSKKTAKSICEWMANKRSSALTTKYVKFLEQKSGAKFAKFKPKVKDVQELYLKKTEYTGYLEYNPQNQILVPLKYMRKQELGQRGRQHTDSFTSF